MVKNIKQNNMKNRLKEMEAITLSIKGGDFIQWHEGLSPIEKLLYKIVFQKLQKSNEKHR